MKVTDSGAPYVPSRRVMRDLPRNWGKSELTQSLALAESNAIATFANMPNWFEALERIDKTLTTNASTLFHKIDVKRTTAARLYMRAFGTFRVACRLALSGQLYETTVLRRSIIESAVYAWACGYSQAHRDAWKARAKGEPEKKAARKAFQWSDLIKLLDTVDAKLAKEIEKLYSKTIDFGAHPNVEGLALSSEVVGAEQGGKVLNTIQIHGSEAILLAVTDLIITMQLVYRLLLISVGDRIRLLNIDGQFTEDVRFMYALIVKHRREKAKR